MEVLSPGILIQCRLKSTRLPYKALRPLGDTTLIGYLIRRLQATGLPVVLCTSTNPQDDPLMNLGVDCYRGSENDLAERFYFAAIASGINPVIRVTGDNPLTDINIMFDLLGQHEGGYTYCDVPRGTKSEIIDRKLLVEMIGLSDQEHTFTEHLKGHPLAKKAQVHTDGLVDCTVDTWQDYQKVRSLCGY